MSSDYSTSVDRVASPEWNRLLALFDDAMVYQSWAYGSVRWGSSSLSHLVLRRADEPVGIAQVSIRRVPRLRCGIAYVPWGPLWRRGGTDPRVFRLMVRALRVEYVVRRGLVLRVAPNVPAGGGDDIDSILREEGFVRSADFYRTWMVDLTKPVDEVRPLMSRRWRNALKKAERLGLEVDEGTGDDLYDAMKALYSEMVARKGFVPGTDIDEFQRIQRTLPQMQQMRLFICRQEGKPVSSFMASRLGDTGLAVLGATGSEGLSSGSTQLLIYRAMQWMRDSGARAFDMGGYDPDIEGTATLKNGLPGQDVSFVGRYDAVARGLSAVAVPFAERMRESTATWKRARTVFTRRNEDDSTRPSGG